MDGEKRVHCLKRALKLRLPFQCRVNVLMSDERSDVKRCKALPQTGGFIFLGRKVAHK